MNNHGGAGFEVRLGNGGFLRVCSYDVVRAVWSLESPCFGRAFGDACNLAFNTDREIITSWDAVTLSDLI